MPCCLAGFVLEARLLALVNREVVPAIRRLLRLRRKIVLSVRVLPINDRSASSELSGVPSCAKPAHERRCGQHLRLPNTLPPAHPPSARRRGRRCGSWHGFDDQLALNSIGLSLHFGSKRKRPTACHGQLGFEAVGAWFATRKLLLTGVVISSIPSGPISSRVVKITAPAPACRLAYAQAAQ